jgi:hypothetical protein
MLSPNTGERVVTNPAQSQVQTYFTAQLRPTDTRFRPLYRQCGELRTSLPRKYEAERTAASRIMPIAP